MQIPKKRLKQVFAGLGALYVVLFAAYLAYAAVNRKSASGPSELELHPEKQAEIRAQQRAEELRDRLNLTPEQTAAVAEIFQKQPPMGGPPGGDPREGFKALREALRKVLTPEQQALEEQSRPRGPGRGRGGPGGPGGPPGMNSERMDAIKEAMSPEQKERFEKQIERMRQRMPMGPGPGGPGGQGGPGGPGGPPPGL